MKATCFQLLNLRVHTVLFQVEPCCLSLHPYKVVLRVGDVAGAAAADFTAGGVADFTAGGVTDFTAGGVGEMAAVGIGADAVGEAGWDAVGGAGGAEVRRCRLEHIRLTLG